MACAFRVDKQLGNGCSIGVRPMCERMLHRVLGGKRDWMRCWYEATMKDGRIFVCRIHGKSKRAQRGAFTTRNGYIMPK